ncbi:unnamed protein product [Calicophoron daubneyi]|uniref:Uncharacterized protein n=1 Tax=Calicophoron daubneyi TaxID=300641 RepID=A0AAV2T9E2_CALDB
MIHVEVLNIRLYPEYIDVAYQHSDSGIVLDTSRRSNMHHWQKPLQELLKTKCRHPIPKHYYLTMHPYLNRHTTARRHRCTLAPPAVIKRNSTPACPPGHLGGGYFYRRSINGQCTQNKASYLPHQRNSFYCTVNSPLVNQLFEEIITERQSYLKDPQCDAQRRLCQTCLRRSCWEGNSQNLGSSQLLADDWNQGNTNILSQSWGREATSNSNSNTRTEQKCCGISCYSNPSCQEYFSPACQAQTVNQSGSDEICLEGKTLKFTLNPEFDLHNGSYMCHLRYIPPKQLYNLRTWISLNNSWESESMEVRLVHSELATSVSKNPSLSSAENFVENALSIKQGFVRMWSGNIELIHNISTELWDEGILNFESSSGNMTLFKLKKADEFISGRPKISRHREEKYAVIQLHYNSVAKLEDTADSGKHRKLSWVTSKPAYIHIEVNTCKIALTRHDRISVDEETINERRCRLLFEEDAVLLLDSGVCEFSSNYSLPASFSIHFVISSSLCFRKKPDNNGCLLHILLNDCHKDYHFYAKLDASKPRNKTSRRNTIRTRFISASDVQHFPQRIWEMDKLYIPFVLVCIVVGALYLILLTVYAVVRACSKPLKHHQLELARTQEPHDLNSRHTGPSVSLSSSVTLLSNAGVQNPVEPLSATRKVVVLAYLCFRVFYTFLFTISVGLSLILSVESNAAREFTAAINNFGNRNSFGRFQIHSHNSLAYIVNSANVESRWRGAKSWMIEAARLEDFAQSELLRQVRSINGQITECGERHHLHHLELVRRIQEVAQHSKQWLNPKTEQISLWGNVQFGAYAGIGSNEQFYNNTWTTNPTELKFPSIEKATWSYLEKVTWLPYLDSVDNHLRKIRDALDAKIIDHWTSFDQLLTNILVNTWVSPARRALNTSWLRVKNVASVDGEYFGLPDMNFYEEQTDPLASGSVESVRSREGRALKLANFIGVPQPAHARLTGARIWNSFRSLVPGLPNKFYYDISKMYEEQVKQTGSARKETIYSDRRYMLSNDDWPYTTAGYAEEDQNNFRQSLVRLQTADGQKSLEKFPSSDSSAYFLSLTEVRLILLLLDAIIILARCYQTFQFMQEVWFGKIERVDLDTSLIDRNLADHRTSLADEVTLVGLEQNSIRSDHMSLSVPTALPPQTSSMHASYVIHQQTIPSVYDTPQGNNGIESPMRRPADSLSINDRHSLSRVPSSTNDLGSAVGGETGRLTACYCCLDAHYLIIVLGIGLLVVGLVLLWATDRHVRPGWLLTKTGVMARSKALEDCRIRTNSILQSIQPDYLNREVLATTKQNFRLDAERLQTTLQRYQHEKEQVALQYFTELCTIEVGFDGRLDSKISRTKDQQPYSTHVTSTAFKLSSRSPCSLFDSSMQFSQQVHQSIRAQDSVRADRVVQTEFHSLAEPPVCAFNPVIPASYAEGQAAHILRLGGLLNRSSKNVNSMRNRSQSSVIYNETTDQKVFTNLDEYLDQLTSATGSLPSLVNAVHRLILTSLTVIIAMGGLLTCLHVAKLLTQRTTQMPVRKIKWISSCPPPSTRPLSLTM